MEEKREDEERESKTREGVFPSLRIPNPNHPISCQSPKTPNQLFHFNLIFFFPLTLTEAGFQIDFRVTST